MTTVHNTNEPLVGGTDHTTVPKGIGFDKLAKTIWADQVARDYVTTGGDPLNQSDDTGMSLSYPDGADGFRQVEYLGAPVVAFDQAARYYTVFLAYIRGAGVTQIGVNLVTGVINGPDNNIAWSFTPIAAYNDLIADLPHQVAGTLGLRLLERASTTEDVGLNFTVVELTQDIVRRIAADPSANSGITPNEIAALGTVGDHSGGASLRTVVHPADYNWDDTAAAYGLGDVYPITPCVQFYTGAAARVITWEAGIKLRVRALGDGQSGMAILPRAVPAFTSERDAVDAWLAAHRHTGPNSFSFLKELRKLTRFAPAVAAGAMALGQPEVAALVTALAAAVGVSAPAAKSKPKKKTRRARA